MTYETETRRGRDADESEHPRCCIRWHELGENLRPAGRCFDAAQSDDCPLTVAGPSFSAATDQAAYCSNGRMLLLPMLLVCCCCPLPPAWCSAAAADPCSNAVTSRCCPRVAATAPAATQAAAHTPAVHTPAAAYRRRVNSSGGC